VPRVFQVGLAVTCLLVLCPVLLLVGLAVYVSLGRPVFFRQARLGLGGRPFVLLKFRTMRKVADSQHCDDESRLVAFGAFLRSTSLDELPELLNVIKGEMNLVGPRPLLPEYLSLYSAEQARRHEVRPGITGWAQVNGRNDTTWSERLKMDVWYIDNQTFLLDVRIVLKTVRTVLSRGGINQEGHATMEKFRGTPG